MVVLVICGLLTIAFAQVPQTATVYFEASTNEYSIVFNKIDTSGAAWGTFEDTLNKTGWSILNIQTAPASNSIYTDNQRMFALGYLEGALTAQHIGEMSLNMNEEFFGSPYASVPADVVAWFAAQDKYNYAQVAANPMDPFWQQVGFTNNQFDGVIAGYNANMPTNGPPMQRPDFQVINAVGDLLDLMSVLGHTQGRYGLKDWLSLSPEEFEVLAFRRGMCSALVKINGDLSDLFAGQSAWFTYRAMNRIFKFYYMDLMANFLAARKMTFSSYPGMLSSLDDFYIMDSGLTMIQTTNSIYNNTLYQAVVPQAVLAWQRVRAANALAADGETWYNTVARENSGTYNNQYMVINYNLFTPGVPLQNGTLWVCEQIPGRVIGADLTWTLERGYFSSYNIPYFYDIYVASGYPAIVEKFGYGNSYQLAPRAQIFRRDQATVSDLTTMKAIMRYNDYLHDPYSKGNSMSAICSRGDLYKPPTLGGCYDTKVTNFAMQSLLQSEAINGPTQSHNLPAFQWISEFNGTAHFGEPELFDFDFVPMQPNFTT